MATQIQDRSTLNIALPWNLKFQLTEDEVKAMCQDCDTIDQIVVKKSTRKSWPRFGHALVLVGFGIVKRFEKVSGWMPKC